MLAGVCAWSAPAKAADDDQGRPWARGTLVPSFGFGFGYSRDLISLGFGLGASYYIANGFSVGLQLDDQVLIYSKSLKADLPNIENQIPTNVFRLTPVAQWVFVRRPRFSPYVFGGVGPAFFNNDNGVFGHWTAGPGAYIGVGGPLYIDLGVGFSGMFPTDACNDAFVYEPETGFSPGVQVLEYCSFRWGPRLGIVLSFGGSSGRKRRDREPAPDPFMEPADNPMDETYEPEPAPQEEPLPEPPPPEVISEPEPDPALEPEPAPDPTMGPEPAPDPGLEPEPAPDPSIDAAPPPVPADDPR